MNCKPGDMAIVLRADGAPASIGRIVEVIEVAPDIDGQPAWVVRFQGVGVCKNKETGELTLDTDADCPDAWLRPISGVPVEDEQHDEVTV
ncbi:hypothetical protein [Cupriavidus sp. D384]|uniref:hypothetical protein n=1 Tax=Cupriavidus sp. D384 TaxID=1538095 RepID=UPI000B2D3E29|nr:hypothetical protein [Cupriavidus sp. D384]